MSEGDMIGSANMVTLRYLKGDRVEIALKRYPLALRHTRYVFSPTLPVDRFIADKILRNPRWMGWFGEEFIPPPSFICEICGFEGKNRLSLLGHKKAHSDKIPHEARSTRKYNRRKPIPTSHPF